MNYLFYTDIHITKESLEECKLVQDEILMLCEKYKIHTVFNLGDSFDGLKPGSAELDLFSDFVKKLNRPLILLVANSHESETHTESVVNHFGILNDNITVVKDYHDEGKLYCGHFIINESKENKGSLSGTKSKKDLKDYKFVVLGHGHNFEIIKPNVCQLGSCRYVSFGEDENIKKKVAIVLDYGEDKEKWGFVDLLSPYPIVNIEVSLKIESKPSKTAIRDTNSVKTADITVDTNDPKSSISQAQTSQNTAKIKELCQKLDKLAPLTKVRIIFKDYSLWREFLPFYQTYKEKFIIFRDKKDFIIEDKVITQGKSDTQTVVESLKKYLIANKVEQKIQDILLEELK